jgi:hypothetical protein
MNDSAMIYKLGISKGVKAGKNDLILLNYQNFEQNL